MSTNARGPAGPDALSTRWTERSAPFTAVVEAVTEWGAPSPCEGWTARDVLEHVLATQRDFLTAHGIELTEPGDADPEQAWAAHARKVTSLLDEDDVALRTFDGYFGPTTVGETLVEFYGFDLVVHRWDLARSQGVEARLTGAELSLVDASVTGWGAHAYAPGIFSAALTPAPGADEQARVLARTGRRA